MANIERWFESSDHHIATYVQDMLDQLKNNTMLEVILDLQNRVEKLGEWGQRLADWDQIDGPIEKLLPTSR